MRNSLALDVMNTMIAKLHQIMPDGRIGRLLVVLSRDLIGIVAVGLVTLLGLWLGGRGDITNAAIAILFVIAIVSMRLGYRAAIFAAGAGALCFDYFFLPPYGSIRITHFRDMLTDAAMFCVAVLISTLNERLRRQAEAARLSERRTEALYALVKDLAGARSVEEVCSAGLGHIETGTGVSALVLIRDGLDGFTCAISSKGHVALEKGDLEVAQWAAKHLEPAGRGTQNWPAAATCYFPLAATRGCVGILAIRSHQDREIFQIEGMHPLSLVQAMAQQLAMAIERMLLSAEKSAAEVEVESERIRNAVLSAVSHDLRTPLTVITSASSTLVEHGDRLQIGARTEMSRLIYEEAKRLSDLLKSLLDVTRLQSGGLRVNREWESLEEVVASALRRVDERRILGLRQLRTHVPSDLPLFQIDAILIEQVLSNLIDNALAYAGNDFPVEIDIAMRGNRDVLISVIDHGEGMQSEELSHIFEKFYRSGGHGGPGLGLGLTLARGIVEAHGGKIWATHTPGGGLTVQFTLPITSVGPQMKEAEISEGMQAWGR
jgi:two-component system sensor histidine kinase KdpD